MPRQLKTFVTNLGFFEMAIAAPSMKAALEAWGMSHNAFQHGFARQTDDPKIVSATMDKPGIVLKRPVGTKGAFSENAELPKDLWKGALPKIEPPKRKPRPIRSGERLLRKRKSDNLDKVAILSFEKCKRAPRARTPKRRGTEKLFEMRRNMLVLNAL